MAVVVCENRITAIIRAILIPGDQTAPDPGEFLQDLKMKRICSGLIVLCLLAPHWALAQQKHSIIDLNLSDDAVRASFATRVRNEGLQVGAGWLHQQDKGDIAHLGLHLVDAAADSGADLTAGIGARVFFVDADSIDHDGSALAVGGFVRYVLPDYNRFSVGAHVYFAPDVVAFGDLSRYSELEARISYNVLRDADVYLGARAARAKFEEGGSMSFNSGIMFGIQMRF